MIRIESTELPLFKFGGVKVYLRWDYWYFNIFCRHSVLIMLFSPASHEDELRYAGHLLIFIHSFRYYNLSKAKNEKYTQRE
jgi:hypothetical protein